MDAKLIEQFIAIVGSKNAITTPEAQAPYLKEWRDMWHGQTPVVLRPGSTAEVSRIMKLAHESNSKIVPQSGNTGLVNGQIPQGDEVLLSLNRMTKIIQLDVADNTITLEGGCILKTIQEAARNEDRLFPLSLGSEGSCRIGGNLSSNAGGLNVLAYGNARDLCLGLEVVLADGHVWNGLKNLRKDNSGYDLKNLFIGAEGTLGIITAAVMKLFPLPKRYDAAFCAMPSLAAALKLLGRAKGASGNRVTGFEILCEIGVEFAQKHMKAVNPLNAPSPWYVLLECADASAAAMDECLAQAFTDDIVRDASIARSEAQRQAFWHLRESMSESQKFEGGSIKHDVSVPVSKVPEFVEAGVVAVLRLIPQARPCPFGHMGDGNIHFNVTQPAGMAKADFLAQWSAMNEVVFAEVLRCGGSFSAEHGIGRLKVQDMLKFKSPLEIEMMRGLKNLFDPKNILNPGRILP